MKKISFKILVVLCVIVIIASTSLFLVSAYMVEEDIPQCGLDVYSADIWVQDVAGNDLITDIEFTDIYSDMYRYKVTLSEPLLSRNTYTLSVVLQAQEQYITTDYSVLGSYEIWLMRNGNFNINEIIYVARSGGNAGYQKPSKSVIGSSNHAEPFPMFKVTYGKQDLNTSYKNYFNTFEFTVNSNTSIFYFYLSEVNLKLTEPGSTAIIENQNENTDKILNAGDDVPQPDFDNTNDSIDNTVGKINSIEGQYKIDADATQSALSEGNNFILGTDMQKASIQVKNWIERFGNENIVISGFLVAAMVLGLCFWVIGRKSF